MDVVGSKKATIISYIVATSFIIAMVAISEVMMNHETFIPEFAAMAMAMWVYREAAWIHGLGSLQRFSLRHRSLQLSDF